MTNEILLLPEQLVNLALKHAFVSVDNFFEVSQCGDFSLVVLDLEWYLLLERGEIVLNPFKVLFQSLLVQLFLSQFLNQFFCLLRKICNIISKLGCFPQSGILFGRDLFLGLSLRLELRLNRVQFEHSLLVLS